MITLLDVLVDHQFEVVVEGIRDLKLFEEMIWGEADCFVQYYFPAQSQSSAPGLQPQHGEISFIATTNTNVCAMLLLREQFSDTVYLYYCYWFQKKLHAEIVLTLSVIPNNINIHTVQCVKKVMYFIIAKVH